jgi:Fe-S cluster biogenesis protein NfuA
MSGNLEVDVLPTPHPRAKKLIINRLLRAAGTAEYTRENSNAEDGPLVAALLALDHIEQLSFAQTVLTITVDKTGDWDTLWPDVEAALNQQIDDHDPWAPSPQMRQPSRQTAELTDPNLQAISVILDRTVRPYIDSHGGDITLISYDEPTTTLVMDFSGSCDGCSASGGSTLYAIQSVLQYEFDPAITITVANPYSEQW